jgi:hypothetical protein
MIIEMCVEPLNHCDHQAYQAIGVQFSLSQRERAGVREGHSGGNALPVHGEVKVCGAGRRFLRSY